VPNETSECYILQQEVDVSYLEPISIPFAPLSLLGEFVLIKFVIQLPKVSMVSYLILLSSERDLTTISISIHTTYLPSN
jgi:hypothetical protein